MIEMLVGTKRHFSKISALIIAILMLISNIAATALAAPTNTTTAKQFTDIKGHWAEKEINDWISKGLIAGYEDNTFRPDNSVTRAEFVTFTDRVFNLTQTTDITFKDVKSTDWFYKEIQKAKAANIVSGYDDNTFRPNNFITREEAAAILTRLLKLQSVTQDALKGFKDASKISSWAKDAVNTAVYYGLIKGYPDNTVGPDNPITRAETVVILDRALKLQQTPIPSPAPTSTIYDKAGTYGPQTGMNTINGDVTISAADVTLQNTTIKGNLLISKAVGDGNVTLKNVIVEGTTTVNGGGEHSIVLEDCTLAQIIVNKDDGKIRLVAKGATKADSVTLQSGGKLEEDNVTGKGFTDVSIEGTNTQVTLIGNYDNIKVNAPGVSVEVASGTVNNLTISDTAKDSKINIDDGVKVSVLAVNAAAAITGKGTIETANINANNVTIEQKPTNTNIASGITAIIGGQKTTGSTSSNTGNSGGGSSSNSGSGGGSSTAPTSTIYDKAGTYGPQTGMNTINGDVTISAADVTLQNTTIKGNLLISKAVGDGNVTLKNVIVEGTTTVNGGGEHSIELENCILEKIVVNKDDGKIRLVASGTTKADSVVLQSGSNLEEDNITDKGFANVIIDGPIPSGSEIRLIGNFENISINAPGVSVKVEKGFVGNVSVSDTAKDSKIDIADGAKVRTLIVNAAAAITGNGIIDAANINVNNVIIDKKPVTMNIASDVTAIIAGVKTGKTGPIDTSTVNNSTYAKLYDVSTGVGSNVVYLIVKNIKKDMKVYALVKLPTDTKPSIDEIKNRGSYMVIKPEQEKDLSATGPYYASAYASDIYDLNGNDLNGNTEYKIYYVVTDEYGNPIDINGNSTSGVSEFTVKTLPIDIKSNISSISSFTQDLYGNFNITIKNNVSGITYKNVTETCEIIACEGAPFDNKDISLQYDNNGTWSDILLNNNEYIPVCDRVYGALSSTQGFTIGDGYSETKNFKVKINKVNHYVFVIYIKDEQGNLIGEYERGISIEAISFISTDIDNIMQGQESQFTVNVKANNVLDDVYAQCKATLTVSDATYSNAAVSSLPINIAIGDNPEVNFTTDSSGVVLFPQDGINMKQLNDGIQIHFKTTFAKPGTYALKLEFEDKQGNTIGGSKTIIFTVK
ncbi:S-layer homology domain-containing protein [Aceticella autotrophica]|uniref:S-layer homology domain-containing protein n=1 Tax=Aceticella autotrophica TaxID=2755338 RepID=A0A975AW25_9THEO|nr:S-layer homology domain-containing protein [Aceticella autotrophica]QSZ27532.1 S-layer homology domain-containing protein [Aceticella autotrophica]